MGWQAALGLDGPRADGRIAVSGDRYDGFRHHSASQRDSVHANAAFRVGATFVSRSFASWTDQAFDIPTVVPKDRVYSNPRGVMGDGTSGQDLLLNVYRRDPQRAARQLRIANRSQWGASDSRQEVGLSWQTTDDAFNNQTSITATDSRTSRAQWQLEREKGAADFRLALAWARSDMDRSLYATSPQNGRRLQRFGEFDLRAGDVGVQSDLRWRVDAAWSLSGSLLWNDVARKARNILDGASLNQSWTDVGGKIGVNWRQNANVRWYANVSINREFPTFWEIVSATVAANNPAQATAELVKLDAQRAATLELGGQGRIGNKEQLMWDVAVYHSRIEDELIATTDSNGIKVGTYNYDGGTRHQGIEAGVSGHLRLGSGVLTHRTAWTVSHFRFRGGAFGGNQIAGIPRHLISTELLYCLGAWGAGPNLRWQPVSSYIDHANTRGATQDSYALLGFKVEYQSNGWNAYAQLENLTDERYASSYVIRDRATAEQPGYLPGNGRSLSAGITYRF